MFKKIGLIVILGLQSWVCSAQNVWTEKERTSLFRQFEETRNELLKTVAPLTEEQFYHRIDSNSWSANDIVEHLSLMEEGYIREFWWALAQPAMPVSYRDSTKDGDEKAVAYATSLTKSAARGTNLPLQRYCSKDINLKVFNANRDLAVEFFTINQKTDMRGYYVFRKNAKGVREIRDLYQQALWLISHTIRHTNQLKSYLADPRFPK